MRPIPTTHLVFYILAGILAIVQFAFVVKSAVAPIPPIPQWVFDEYPHWALRRYRKDQKRYHHESMRPMTAWGVFAGLTMVYYIAHNVTRFVRPKARFLCIGANIAFNVALLIPTVVIFAVIAANPHFNIEVTVPMILAIVQMAFFVLIILFEGVIAFKYRRSSPNGHVLTKNVETLTKNSRELERISSRTSSIIPIKEMPAHVNDDSESARTVV